MTLDYICSLIIINDVFDKLFLKLKYICCNPYLNALNNNASGLKTL